MAQQLANTIKMSLVIFHQLSQSILFLSFLFLILLPFDVGTERLIAWDSGSDHSE